MKLAAIVANAAQLTISLVIFAMRGLDLGALVIGLLFILMAVPFVNFLALFFSSRSMTGAAADEIEANGLVKRVAMRVHYRQAPFPELRTGGAAFTVLDLSEGGVRIRASPSTPFKNKVKGEIALISGARIRFKATVMRREEGETVFQFTDPIGTALLLEEERAMRSATAP